MQVFLWRWHSQTKGTENSREEGKGGHVPSEIPTLKFFSLIRYRICDIQLNFQHVFGVSGNFCPRPYPGLPRLGWNTLFCPPPKQIPGYAPDRKETRRIETGAVDAISSGCNTKYITAASNNDLYRDFQWWISVSTSLVSLSGLTDESQGRNRC